MKIARVTTRAVRVNHRGDWIFVRVETDDGLVGWGEASHSGDDRAVRVAIETLGRRAVGRPPFDIEWITNPAATAARGMIASVAASGLEHALWDLIGKTTGQPVHNLLGGRLRDRVRLYANINRSVVDRSPDAYAAKAVDAVAEGFQAIKCAPFDGVEWSSIDDDSGRRALRLGLDRVRAIRRAIGPEIDLSVDCHGRFDVPTGRWVADQLVPERLYWFEEPIAGDDASSLLQIKPHVSTRLVGGENRIGREGFRDLLERHAVDAIMIDLKFVGGILEGKKIAAMAETYHVAVSPHSPAGPVASAAGAQLCATLPNFLVLEYAWGEVPWRADLVGGESIVDGYVVLSERPGLGIGMNERLLNEHDAD